MTFVSRLRAEIQWHRAWHVSCSQMAFTTNWVEPVPHISYFIHFLLHTGDFHAIHLRIGQFMDPIHHPH